MSCQNNTADSAMRHAVYRAVSGAVLNAVFHTVQGAVWGAVDQAVIAAVWRAFDRALEDPDHPALQDFLLESEVP